MENETTTTTALYGGVSESQLKEWNDKYHNKLCVITVQHPVTGNALGCYLKPMGRNEIAIATSYQAEKKLVEGGEIILENCWLGGDAVLRNPSGDVFDEQAATSAALASWKNFPKLESKAVKNG